jgi:23S rRNA pseudouridine1911/1915/1917 synthase
MEKYKEIIEVKAEDKDKGKRLDAFLSEFFQDATRSYIQKLIDNKNIMIDGKSKTKSGNKLKGNEKKFCLKIYL